MHNNKQLTEDDFYNKYTTEYNQVILKELLEKEDTGSIVINDMAPYSGCMYETHGEEIAYVLEVANKTPRKVWTIISVDGWEGIVAGYHLVNRLGYLITDEEWESETEEYVVYDEGPVNDWFFSLTLSEKKSLFSELKLDRKKDEEDQLADMWDCVSLCDKEDIMNNYKSKN